MYEVNEIILINNVGKLQLKRFKGMQKDELFQFAYENSDYTEVAFLMPGSDPIEFMSKVKEMYELANKAHNTKTLASVDDFINIYKYIYINTLTSCPLRQVIYRLVDLI